MHYEQALYHHYGGRYPSGRRSRPSHDLDGFNRRLHQLQLCLLCRGLQGLLRR